MSEIANYFTKVFTDPKSMFFVAIGLMLLIVAGIAINDASDCQALNSDTITKIKAINYAMIVIGFLFVGVGLARSSKHSFIVDYIEIVCGILGVAVFICGLLFLTTANDIVCPTAVTTCAHVQWVTGLIISLGSVYFWYNKNKGSFGSTDDDEDTDDGGDGAEKKKKKILSTEEEIGKIQEKIEQYEAKHEEALRNEKLGMAEKIEEKINDLKVEKNDLEIRFRTRKSQQKSRIAQQQEQIKNIPIEGGAPKKEEKKEEFKKPMFGGGIPLQ